LLQLDPSAQAPWTSTTFTSLRDIFLSFAVGFTKPEIYE
jgi:hypothetical protein